VTRPGRTPRLRTGPLPFVLVVLVSVVVLFSPASATPSGLPPGADTLTHLVLFAALAWTGRRAGLPVGGLAVGLVAYAVASEVLQAVLPFGRSADPLDAVADVVGAALGLIASRRAARAPG
jgi:VanZ family protein